MLPVDTTERDRLDVMHTLLKTARPTNAKLTHVPTDVLTRVAPSPALAPKVMDLGCGTGLWMLQMAERFTNAEFYGFDINHMLPITLLSNIVPYVPCDIESPWSMGRGHWTMIHAQLMLGSITSWNYLFQQTRSHLEPGGWFESVEIDWKPRCDDGTMNENSQQPGLMQWWDRVSRAYRTAHHALEYNHNIDRDLEGHGFKDITHYKYQIPLCGWHSTDPVKHRVGSWWNIAMSPGNTDEGCFGLEAMSLRPLLDVDSTAWTPALVQRLCREALTEASDLNVHAYNELHIVIARAPRLDGT